MYNSGTVPGPFYNLTFPKEGDNYGDTEATGVEVPLHDIKKKR